MNRTLLLAVAGLAVGLPPVARAQSVRVTGTTSLQSVGVRPLVDDSVAVTEATGTGPYRQLADGRLVRCVEGEPFCRFRRSGDAITSVPVVQDLQAAAWGFGQGISAHAHLRGRESLGSGAFLWPRAGDRFDALEAYLQVERDRFRVRLGRQWAVNGLGLYNFDGGSLLLRRGLAAVEAFGGVSLVAGLNDAHDSDALGEVDDLPPDERAWLVGARASLRLRGAAIAGVYQRVIRADRAGLYAERVGIDASTRAFGATWDVFGAYDLQAADLNDARLRVARELAGRFSGTLEARRHRPFFEAWTIWGAFSPVPFNEGRAILGWHDRSGRISADVSGAWRSYDESRAGLQSAPLRTDGWRAGAGIEWSPVEAWFAHADYNVDIGFGASRSDAAAGVRWSPAEHVFLGGTLSAFQNIYEFRVGTGRVIGLGLEGGTRVARDARIVIDAALYRHTMSNNAPSPDWSQRRLSTRLEWTLGRDPGTAVARQ